jgi:GNAT superfamily N-acetyltransferase
MQGRAVFHGRGATSKRAARSADPSSGPAHSPAKRRPDRRLRLLLAVPLNNISDRLSITLAEPPEAPLVAEILLEAAAWLEQRGTPMWRLDELAPERIAAEVAQGLFALARCDRDAAGTIRFELEDRLFWPDVAEGEAAYVHRFAVRRRFAGGSVSSALLDWAVRRTRGAGRPYLRLDCEASRPRLRAVYEGFGFQYHSEHRVGPYLVARYELRV